MEKKSVLIAKSLSKTFKNPHDIVVLKDIDFSLAQGESVAIIGSSGSGKSTLLSILGTLEDPTNGEVTYASAKNQNVAELRANHIGFVFQSYNLLEDYTLLDNLLLRASLGNRSTDKESESYKEALILLEELGLSARKDHKCKLLSGGEKQRGALARALMNHPHILFADEPTGNLDRETSEIMENLLFEEAKKRSQALLLVTHDLALAKRCDRILKLENGVLLEMAHEKILHS